MDEYANMVRRQRQWMLYLLAFFVLGAGFSSYTRVFNGLLLGGIISFYNLWLLQRKINVFGKSISETGAARQGLGTFSRLAAVALSILIALEFEEFFHIIAVVIGIVSSYIVMALDILFRSIKNRNKHGS